MWPKLFGSILMLIGALWIFDGRRVVRKYLNFGEENLATQGIKIVGFLLVVVGGFLIGFGLGDVH